MSEGGWDEKRLIRVQAGSGLLFGTFLVLHLTNTIVGGLGQETYDALQGALRWYYQFPAVEIVAIGAAGITHVVVGLTRMIRRRRKNQIIRRSGITPPGAPTWLRIHRASGYFLLVVILGHYAATRGPGLFFDMPADFSFLHFSLLHWPLFMYPYYFLLFGCGAFHLLHGGVVALNVVGWKVGPPSRAWMRFAFYGAFVVGVIGVLSMGGAFKEVDTSRFDDFRAFYERYAPFMVVWD